ncbi:hypothetical protein HAX54_049921 [Datura stramonium]|uniref:Uncharacterized protein n=1 Tax=Datura stramonium TaxID=4076 RepID=A0ABS8RQT4_DATST|nr:hypothetical protein [Datura stramonium]
MANPPTIPSLVDVHIADEAPSSTQGELPSIVSTTVPGIDDVEISSPNQEKVPTMDDTSQMNDDEDNDDVPLSDKWEIFETMKITSARKHIVVKLSPPKRPRIRGALRIQKSMTFIDVEVSSDEENSPSKPVSISEEPAPKRKRA